MLRNTDLRAGVEDWLHCSGYGLSESLSVSSEADSPLDRWYEEEEYAMDLSMLV